MAEVEWDAGVPAHGTFIAAIVAGTGDNGVGRAGLAPKAGLNLLKISDSSGALYYSYAASALADVADGDLGIRAVNYSIASSSYTSSFADAVDSLATVDVVLVAAAGNCSSAHCSDADNDEHPLYPASFSDDHVISVAGSTRDGGMNSYSHYGASSVDLAAPGVDICSAGVDDTDDYYTAAGTSYAAPLVAAAVALLLETHPDLSTLELARVLRASAAGHADWEGRVRSGGVLDAKAALHTAVPRFTEPPDLRVDGTATLDLQLANQGALGEAVLVLGHDHTVEVVGAPTGWTVEPFIDGDRLELVDAGSVTVDGPGTLVRGALDQHQARTLSLELAGRALGSSTASARLVLASAGADYLNAPYDEGESDLTGFLAYRFDVQVTELAPDDTGGSDSGGSDSGSSDGGALAQDDEVDEDDGGAKGGCSTTPDTASLWGVALVSLAYRRRRSRGC